MLIHFKMVTTPAPGFAIPFSKDADQAVTLAEDAFGDQNYMVSMLTKGGKTYLVVDPMG